MIFTIESIGYETQTAPYKLVHVQCERYGQILSRSSVSRCDDEPSKLPPINQNLGLVGDVSFVTDGDVQMHLTKKDILNSFRSGQTVNPLERGHIAYRTDDIEAFKVHLDNLDVPYSDWGSDAVKGWHQIFFYDPEGNVIEVHQIVKK